MNSSIMNTRHYISGRWEDSPEHIDVYSPIDGRTIGRIPSADSKCVDIAVHAARSAFRSWSSVSLAQRLAYVRAMGEYIADNSDRFAEVECNDTGFLLSFMKSGLVRRAAKNFSYYADFAERLGAKPQEINGKGASNWIFYKPAGVVAVIIPWNAPLVLATWKVAAALAAGNTIVLKPAELAPLSCALLAEAAEAINLPAGVFNVIHGTGKQAGAALAEHAAIDRLAFTGSTVTAKSIGESCALSITPVSFELGGKSPLIVFADSDLQAACDQVLSQFNHAGQICAAGTRIIVESDIEPKFRTMVLSSLMEKAVVGDPRHPDTTVGPLISEDQLVKVEGFVNRALACGATLLAGGKRHSRGGQYFEPTIMTDVAMDAEIYQEEVFGPVLIWSTFVDDQDAVTQANATRYGLGGYLWCNDSARALAVAQAIRTGTVWVNGSTRDLDTPFGGCGDSGIGREGGLWGWEFFSDITNVAIKKFRSQST
ncbi:aldehyde dehydrogenase family protein [Alcaligenaceae bacterium]|nr:aldehyde dehydrogenase family protein [Alcaligenaceae bacterium]